MRHIIRFAFAIFVTFLSFIDIGMKRFGHAKANVHFQQKYNYLYSTTLKKKCNFQFKATNYKFKDC